MLRRKRRRSYEEERDRKNVPRVYFFLFLFLIGYGSSGDYDDDDDDDNNVDLGFYDRLLHQGGRYYCTRFFFPFSLLGQLASSKALRGFYGNHTRYAWHCFRMRLVELVTWKKKKEKKDVRSGTCWGVSSSQKHRGNAQRSRLLYHYRLNGWCQFNLTLYGPWRKAFGMIDVLSLCRVHGPIHHSTSCSERTRCCYGTFD